MTAARRAAPVKRLLAIYDAIPAWLLAAVIFAAWTGLVGLMCLEAWRWAR